MKISIVTIVRNNREYIADAVQSVLEQDYPHIEHVIVDGLSTDGTVEYLQSCERRPGTLISEADTGIYNALNKGLKLATGDFVGFVHSDDYLDSSTTISQIAAQLQQSGADMIYGDLEYVQAENPTQVVRYWQSGDFHPKIMLGGWMPPHPTVFVRRSLLAKHGYYREDMKIAADYEWMLRYIHFAQVHPTYLPQVICKMRLGGTSNKNLKNLIRKTREDLLSWRLNGKRFRGYIAIVGKNLSKVQQFWRRRAGE